MQMVDAPVSMGDPSIYGGQQIMRRGAWIPAELRARIAAYHPGTSFGAIVRTCLAYLPAEQAAELLEGISRIVVIESSLAAVRSRWDERRGHYVREDFGVVSRRMVTTAGVNYIVDAFQNTTELENLKFHGLGTGVTAEAVGDTALVTELTTQYTGDVRATGTTVEGGSANIYRTVGTNTLDSGSVAVTEHGVFSAVSGGTLLDRSVFSAINLVGTNGDGLQTTFDLTVAAGG
jgi:hypothetical protein